jgi:hypothetical protein
MPENMKQRMSDELQRCRATFEQKGVAAGWDMSKEGPGKYLSEQTQLRWQGYFLAWMEVNFKTNPPRHILDIRDKNGKKICEGDIVVGHRGWMTGDGRLPKRYPESVRILLEVVWNEMTGAYELNELGYHPEDEEFGQSRNYREILYRLEVSAKRLSDSIYLGGTFRKDRVCEELEVYASPAMDAQLTAPDIELLLEPDHPTACISQE